MTGAEIWTAVVSGLAIIMAACAIYAAGFVKGFTIGVDAQEEKEESAE